jgi:hypothetical protein
MPCFHDEISKQSQDDSETRRQRRVLAHIPFDADVMMSKKLLSALMDVGRSRSGLMKQCCGSRRGYVHRTAAAGEGG